MEGHYGVDYYGKTEHVRGMFYVSTFFFHFNYFPLYPIKSCLMLDGASGNDAEGLDIPLYQKSVVLGYLRGWLGGVAIIFLAIGCFVTSLFFWYSTSDWCSGVALFGLLCTGAVVRQALLTDGAEYWPIVGVVCAAAIGATIGAVVLAMQPDGLSRGQQNILPLLLALPLGSIALLGHGVTHIWSTPAVEDALALATTLNLEKEAVERRLMGMDIESKQVAAPNAHNEAQISGAPGDFSQ